MLLGAIQAVPASGGKKASHNAPVGEAVAASKPKAVKKTAWAAAASSTGSAGEKKAASGVPAQTFAQMVAALAPETPATQDVSLAQQAAMLGALPGGKQAEDAAGQTAQSSESKFIGPQWKNSAAGAVIAINAGVPAATNAAAAAVNAPKPQTQASANLAAAQGVPAEAAQKLSDAVGRAAGEQAGQPQAEVPQQAAAVAQTAIAAAAAQAYAASPTMAAQPAAAAGASAAKAKPAAATQSQVAPQADVAPVQVVYKAAANGVYGPVAPAKIKPIVAPVAATVDSDAGFTVLAGQTTQSPSLEAAATQALGASAAMSSGAAQSAATLPGVISGQIASAFQASAAPMGQQVVISLNPPELGRVRLTINSHENEIRGVMRVDSPATLEEMRRETPLLMHRLAQSGLDVRRMDVVLNNSSSGQSSLQNQQSSSGWAQHQGDGSPFRMDVSDWASPQASAGSSQDELEPVAAGSISYWA